MKSLRLLLLAAVAGFAVPAGSTDLQRGDVGSIDRLEVTGLTRQRASTWLRTVLPASADGFRQTFTGEVRVAGIEVPVTQPAKVMVQPRRDGSSDAVFFLDLELKDVPASLLPKLGPHAVGIELQGTLRGEKGTEKPVFAVGLLRFGTEDVSAPSSFAGQFVSYEGASLKGLSFSTTTGEARVKLYNPLKFEVTVALVEWSVWAGKRKISSGSLTGPRLKASSENVVALPLEVSNADLIASAGTAIRAGGTIDGRVLGRVVVKAGGERMTVPIDVSGPIKITP